MRCDDDSFLSAYLDGQLDADQQQMVESVLVARPQFADKLRDLAAVRDIVVGLNRDSRVDVSSDVMERIRRRSRPRLPLTNFRPWSPRTRKLAASAGLFAAVAGLVLMVNLSSIEHKPIVQADSAARGTLDNQIFDSGSEATAQATEHEATTVALVGPPSIPESALKISEPGGHDTAYSTASLPDDPTADRDRAISPGDLAFSRELLDRPGKRRFFLVNGRRDGNAEQQIVSIVERTTRFKFCKITVSQGIVIDPRHPDQATVFAFLVNPNEADRVFDQIKSVLPDAIEETPTDPAIVTQLADIAHVRASSPAPLADVMIPREDLALKTRAAGSGENAANSASTPVRQGALDTAKEHARNESKDLIVVFVWMCQPKPS